MQHNNYPYASLLINSTDLNLGAIKWHIPLVTKLRSLTGLPGGPAENYEVLNNTPLVKPTPLSPPSFCLSANLSVSIFSILMETQMSRDYVLIL